MSTRLKVVGGSLAGALAIHALFFVTSHCSPKAVVATADGGRDAGFVDALVDVLRDVVGSEVADANAQDAATNNCNCPTPTPPPVPVYAEQGESVASSGDGNWATIPNTSTSVTVGSSGLLDLQASGGVRLESAGTAVCAVRFVVDGAAPAVEGDAHQFLGAGASFLTSWSILRRVAGLAPGPHTVSLQIARIGGFGTGVCLSEGGGFTFRRARMFATPR